MKQLGPIIQKQVETIRERMNMTMQKKLKHYNAGGTLVSPEGHTLKKELGGITKFKGEIGAVILDTEGAQLTVLADCDWEIQREPGVYRVSADDDDATVVLMSWNGKIWKNPLLGVTIETPADELIIERVEAEPTSPTPKNKCVLEEAFDAGSSSRAAIISGNSHQSFEDWFHKNNFTSPETVMDRLKRAADGFVPDWDDKAQIKQELVYNHGSEEWETNMVNVTQRPGTVYFRTAKDAQAAIDELGEELRG